MKHHCHTITSRYEYSRDLHQRESVHNKITPYSDVIKVPAEALVCCQNMTDVRVSTLKPF